MVVVVVYQLLIVIQGMCVCIPSVATMSQTAIVCYCYKLLSAFHPSVVGKMSTQHTWTDLKGLPNVPIYSSGPLGVIDHCKAPLNMHI